MRDAVASDRQALVVAELEPVRGRSGLVRAHARGRDRSAPAAAPVPRGGAGESGAAARAIAPGVVVADPDGSVARVESGHGLELIRARLAVRRADPGDRPDGSQIRGERPGADVELPAAPVG